jgi:hypothetical protein
MDNVVSLAEYRTSAVTTVDRTDDELRSMFYQDLIEWCGVDFDRLLAAAKARDYRPEWVGHQLENAGLEPTPEQDAILARLVDQVGPFVSRRQRWILRQIQTRPLYESKLVTKAAGAAEYRDLKHVDRGVAHDLKKLVEIGRIKVSVGGCVTLVSGTGPVEAASAAPGAAMPRIIPTTGDVA